MDRGILIKELASQIGITEDTVVNWEIRGVKPSDKNLVKLKTCLKMKNI